MLSRSIREALPDLETSASEADRISYSRDLWPRHHLAVRAGKIAEHKPACVVWPKNEEQVVGIVEFANQTGTPIVPFGAGSGVCAAVLPSKDMIVIDLKKLDAIKLGPKESSTVEVGAGYLGIKLEEWLGHQGFTLGHFPSSIVCSTVGGWIAGRSAGQNSGYYGKIEDMVVSASCVMGTGKRAVLHHRKSGPNLLPLVIGSEGTLAIVTSATLRIHPAPRVRGFVAFSFPSTEAGWEAMREVFQSGYRPAVCRLYDPFDAMLAKRGAVKREKTGPSAPGLGAMALRQLLRFPGAFNELLDSDPASAAMGGALVVMVFEGDESVAESVEGTKRVAARMQGEYLGEGPARKWFEHRYSVSYRQAPVIASGLFLDTMEVAASWSNLRGLFHGVREALGKQAFVMAHLSHAYPDGCCIYFSFAGIAGTDSGEGWDADCEKVYDATWRRALDAAVAAGGTLAHHHGVGRSKAPRLPAELGVGLDVVRAVKRAWDPKGILNPGALFPEGARSVQSITSNFAGVLLGN